jgi:phospholipase/lecithinase/hemolysin
MNRSRLIATIVAASCSAFTGGFAAAAPYSSVYAFGDSLSDMGNVYAFTGGTVPAPPAYAAGRFSNGPVAVEVMTQLLTGAPLTLAHDYAWGGALTGISPTTLVDNNNPPLNGHGLLAQTSKFHSSLSGGQADPNALYVVWAGSNDFKDPTVLTNAGGQQWGRVIGNIEQSIANLAADGARHFFVPNMPNLGLIPLVTGTGAANAAGASLLTAGYNATFAAGLTALDAGNSDIDIKTFNVYGLMTSIINDVKLHGSAFGFTNVTTACQTDPTCTDPSQAFFWDLQHPTAHVQEILGTAFAAAVPEPETYALMLGGLAIVGWATRRQRRAMN